MNRLDRRLTLLRAKRGPVFDSDQYWLEQAARARVARKVRSRLRRMQPVVLLTPRWSSPRRFLDDIATDLMIGTPEVVARTLDCAPLKTLTPHQAWAWLASAMAELSAVHLGGPAWQAISRLGFKSVMMSLMQAMEERHGRRCLMLHGLEHIPLDALEDLTVVFEDYRDSVENPNFNMLLAGSIPNDHIHVEGAGKATVLQDFTSVEAVEALVEDLGPLESHRLESMVELVGGIPQILEALADEGKGVVSQVVADPDALWTILGPLSGEIRGAFEIVASDERLSARMEVLAREGPQPEEVGIDRKLVQAGVAQRTKMRGGQRVQMRSPCFMDFALAS